MGDRPCPLTAHGPLRSAPSPLAGPGMLTAYMLGVAVYPSLCHQEQRRGLNKSLPKPTATHKPPCVGVFSQERPTKSTNRGAESHLGWRLANLVCPAPLVSLPSPAPLPCTRGSSVHLVV